jgi:hypothetical protein
MSRSISSRSVGLWLLAAVLAGCGEEKFASVYRIEEMAQVIGGPARGARPPRLRGKVGREPAGGGRRPAPRPPRAKRRGPGVGGQGGAVG